MKNLWLLVSFLLFFHGVSAKRRKKPSDGKHLKNGEIETVCSLKGRADEYLHCVCSDGFPPYYYKTAQCWIFSEINQQDEIWNLFLMQANLTKLTLMLRPEVPMFAIPTRILTLLRKLENLTIYFGNIKELPAFSFPGHLKEIIVSGSGVTKIARHSFYNLPNLHLLQLDDNDIYELQQEVFVKLPNLKKLILSKNNISSIQDGTFSHLANLTELRLDSNSLITLTNLTFKELGHLKVLMLDNNKFERFDDYVFEQLWDLEVLDLDSNELARISNRTFAGLISLEELILSNNRLTSLPEDLLAGILTIRYLDLRNNMLQKITQQTVAPVLANIEEPKAELFLAENEFHCDCNLNWMVSLYNETNISKIKDVLREITCTMPAKRFPQGPTTVSTFDPIEWKFNPSRGDEFAGKKFITYQRPEIRRKVIDWYEGLVKFTCPEDENRSLMESRMVLAGSSSIIKFCYIEIYASFLSVSLLYRNVWNMMN